MNDDLISREALIDRYYAEWEKQDICDGREDRNWLMQCIDEAPAVDAVEVVRCSKCIYGVIDDPNFPNQYFCRSDGDRWNSGEYFCSDGEPRMDGE